VYGLKVHIGELEIEPTEYLSQVRKDRNACATIYTSSVGIGTKAFGMTTFSIVTSLCHPSIRILASSNIIPSNQF